MPRALLFGSTGQLGSSLLRAEWPKGWEPAVAAMDVYDLAQPERLEQRLLEAKPDAILNAAAYTAVDKAESEPELAEKVNALAPGAMARVATRLDIPLLHVSTDYVFDGELEGREYVETDTVRPLSVYGKTKEHGERLVRLAPKHFIVRTSWVYSATGANFVKTMLRVGRERPELKVVADQLGRPTEAFELGRTLLALLQQPEASAYGTYHYAGGRALSWHAFAEAIFAAAARHGYTSPQVTPIATHEYPTAAVRPKNSRLDGTKLAERFGIHQHDFDGPLERCITALLKELQ